MCRNQRRTGGYNHNVFASGNIVGCCQRSGTSCCGQLVVEIAGFKSEISQTSLKVSDLCTLVASLTNSVLTKGVNLKLAYKRRRVCQAVTNITRNVLLDGVTKMDCL